MSLIVEFNSKKLVRKSSSFSSISSEILADESLNSDFILPQLMSERRERSYDQLDILDSPIRKNIAAKTVRILRKLAYFVSTQFLLILLSIGIEEICRHELVRYGDVLCAIT